VSKVSVTPPVNPTGIILQSPVDGTAFDPCALVATHQPTFNWTATGTFSGLSIQFSTSPTDFKTFGVLLSKAALRTTSVSFTPAFFSWKSILTASYNKGNVRDIYWKLVGTLPDKTIVESEVRSFRIGPPQPVVINSPAEGVTLPFNSPPSFDMITNCNVKFTLEFSRSDAFSDPKTTKKIVFTLKDPILQPTVQKTLTSLEWTSVRKLLAPRGYFRIKASDAIGRETLSEVRSFNIQSMLIGNWDVTGMVTTTVALVGRFPVTQRVAAVDAFTFSADGTFQMIDMSGTYTEQGTTFTVNLLPADVELYFEQGLGAALSAPVDVTVTSVSFKGTENWTAGVIAGAMTMSMWISVPSLGLQGTVKATVTFRGIRSPVQGLSLSAHEVSSPSLIRVIGGDINKSIQGIKNDGK
jgi:hypothetical protein